MALAALAVNCRTWCSTVPLNSYNGHFATMNSNGCPDRVADFFNKLLPLSVPQSSPLCASLPLSLSLLLPCVLAAVVVIVVVVSLTHTDTHTRAHDMHTMTADCWLPKAPEAYESSTNRVKSE